MMFTCAHCTVLACRSNDLEKMPKNCPMRQQAVYEEVMPEYQKPENKELFIEAAKLEHDGYCEWNRVREIIELCKRMHYQKVGLAFCVGLQKEAKIFVDIMKRHGIEVTAIICKNGSFDKESFGIPKESKLKPESFEAACNPIAQARFLAEEGTDFNVLLGLCVGHDTLFFKYSQAPLTVLAVKDRVLGHNPCVALYCADGYFKKKFGEETE